MRANSVHPNDQENSSPTVISGQEPEECPSLLEKWSTEKVPFLYAHVSLSQVLFTAFAGARMVFTEGEI